MRHPPLSLRELKAKMVLKALSLKSVAKRAHVHYPTASLILSGRLQDAKRLSALRRTIEEAPMPIETHTA
jgi:hypothetical protein